MRGLTNTSGLCGAYLMPPETYAAVSENAEAIQGIDHKTRDALARAGTIHDDRVDVKSAAQSPFSLCQRRERSLSQERGRLHASVDAAHFKMWRGHFSHACGHWAVYVGDLGPLTWGWAPPWAGFTGARRATGIPPRASLTGRPRGRDRRRFGRVHVALTFDVACMAYALEAQRIF